MITKTYNVNIQAKDEAQCKQVMDALMMIKKTVTTEQLIRLANACEKKPGLIQQADSLLKLKGL